MDNIFDDETDCKRILREIALLQKLKHPCVVELIEILEPKDPKNFSTIYMVLEFAESDLKKILKSSLSLEILHIQTIIYNLLCAVKFLHESKVIHRDLKPANVLINEDCSVKLCDFGLARSLCGVENSSEDIIKKVELPKEIRPKAQIQANLYNKCSSDELIVEDTKVDDLKDHVELDLDSIIREIEGLDEEEKEEEEVEENNELEEVKNDLKEHRDVIKYLREKLNEVNLLNAKLLYTNKLFRNHNLNDNQKLKVVETFDRAANLREVKLVFTTLAESFDGVRNVRKRSVNESVASKAVASTKPKQEIVEESNDVADRFKQLAGLIK